MGKNKKRTKLSLQEKIIIIEFSMKNPSYSQRDLSNKYRLSLEAINNVIKDKDKISKAQNKKIENLNSNFKTKVFDNKLLEWFNQKRSRNITIQDFNLKEMAKKYEVNDFVASGGWIHSFKKRHGIKSKRIQGESGLTNKEVIKNFQTIYQKKWMNIRLVIFLIVMKRDFSLNRPQ